MIGEVIEWLKWPEQAPKVVPAFLMVKCDGDAHAIMAIYSTKQGKFYAEGAARTDITHRVRFIALKRPQGPTR